MDGPDEKTPIRTRDGSRVARTFNDLLDELVRAERDLRPLARVLDQLPEDERWEFLDKLEERLRVIGDLGHRSAQTVWIMRHERRSGGG